ncbi:MAG TPA: acyl-CoA dehydrogenase [Gammaproteobacteria bacterium]|nr:acyl-CoA dehydrogenase [Gammaproteobacteria bacterium]
MSLYGYMIAFRKKIISAPLFHFIKHKTPKMSDTELDALRAGTVNWDAELFSGKPDWKKLFAFSKPKLTTEEKAFINGPVEELCSKINDWQITHIDADLPKTLWKFIKDKGFWALIIPKKFGGKAFSAYAHSEILSKIYGVSVTVGSVVNVPNSLGPAELILKYGTDEQKEYYLPRLAKGKEIPCFALTGPEAGSDASSLTDTGIVCRGSFEGKQIIGIKLNWDKRYITLAPVATVLGLAFKLFDPNKLIGNKEEYGITCALIPTDLEGITIGRRHFPLNATFQNGPTQGKNVFIPLDWIIGGVSMAGNGWRMLMECLSVGRGISLPSSALGGSRMAVFATGAYARIRKQFHLPIGKFEGVREVLARMAGNLYVMDATRRLTLSIIDDGEHPSVLTAITKYHTTELGRKIACDAMDVHGGKGICLGPRNYLARFFESMPVGITVEGANILTRSMIIFGQGAIRCHRFIFKEMVAMQENNLNNFDKALFGHIKLFFSNLGRTVFLGFTGGRLSSVPNAAPSTEKYYKYINRFSAVFALLSDTCLIMLGAQLKRKEHLSARLGDILSYLYMLSATLKRFEDDGRQEADFPLVQWVCESYFYHIQSTINDILDNFPSRMTAFMLRALIFPWGRNFKKPKDDLTQVLSDVLLSPSSTRDRLTAGMFKGNVMAVLQEALEKVDTADGEALRKEVIAVDDFDPKELMH